MTNIVSDATLENYLCLYFYKTDSFIVETMATTHSRLLLSIPCLPLAGKMRENLLN